MAIEFDYFGSDLSQNLETIKSKALAGVKMYATTKAPTITSKMQTTRPWTDRTNMAKTRLDTIVSVPSDTVVRLTLSHGVWYGIYLELANEKKYAIIKPTIDSEKDNMVKDMNKLFSVITRSHG